MDDATLSSQPANLGSSPEGALPAYLAWVIPLVVALVVAIVVGGAYMLVRSARRRARAAEAAARSSSESTTSQQQAHKGFTCVLPASDVGSGGGGGGGGGGGSLCLSNDDLEEAVDEAADLPPDGLLSTDLLDLYVPYVAAPGGADGAPPVEAAKGGGRQRRPRQILPDVVAPGRPGRAQELSDGGKRRGKCRCESSAGGGVAAVPATCRRAVPSRVHLPRLDSAARLLGRLSARLVEPLSQTA